MSRNALCLITASGLAAASVALMIGRACVLGDELKAPAGPGTWKVTLVVSGRCVGNNARLMTATPLDIGHQQLLHEDCRSSELLAKPPDARHPERRQVLWSQRAGVGSGPFRVLYQFYCTVKGPSSSSPRSSFNRAATAPPVPGEHLETEPRIESDDAKISALARDLTSGLEEPRDLFDALFHHVDQNVGNEPSIQETGMTALQCVQAGSGDSGAKSRLLVALCRNRGIPARLVNGITLKKGHEQKTHIWVEAWLNDHWLPACPFHHHLGRLPINYLVFQYGDVPVVRGRHIRDLKHAFLVERTLPAEGETADAPGLRRFLRKLSLYSLPTPEQRLVEFLLLLPIAALVVCVFRNLIGLKSFGTFAPALVGLAFRDLGGLPGILVFVSIVLVGWVMRRVLEHYHLLQVPRTAFLLSLVVVVLITAIVGANYHDLPATRYVSLFPIVILTGMIERFWTLEVEDGTTSSFRTLLGTMLIAAVISLLLSLHAVVRHMFRFPETLGIVMALQLLLGRYTGYRLSELYRFRDLIAVR
jgi:hypothetical protein